MPEGDTLHAHARRIEQALAGGTLVRAESSRVPLGRFVGHVLRGARAQGKHLLIELDTGHLLRTHLRMHGTIRVRDGCHEGPIFNPHVRWLLATAEATAVCLDAPSVELLHTAQLDDHRANGRSDPG